MLYKNGTEVKEIGIVIDEEIKLFPFVSKDYIAWELADFFIDDNFNESYQSHKDVATVLSNCLNKLGIKNEITRDANLYIVKRLEV